MNLTEPQRKKIFDILLGKDAELLDEQARAALEDFAAQELTKIEEVLAEDQT